MEKANNMMTDNDMMCWHALYTAPKSEHKLMQRLNAAGYTTYCPMQAVFVKWKGHTYPEGDYPSFFRMLVCCW